jgi:OOP family OmpA-OmpF porin
MCQFQVSKSKKEGKKMKLSTKLLTVLFGASLMAGCTTGPKSSGTFDKNFMCAVGGALVAGAGAAAVADDDEGAAAAGGAAVGAMLGLLLCPNDEVEAAEPVAAAPVCATAAPSGALVDANGCPFDDDNDGVYEGIDMCRNTPAGVTVDRVGCPLDTDGDAVADYLDLCPDTPKGVIVDQDGCPLAGEKVLSLTGVNFAFDKADLTADAKEILGQAVTVLKDVDGVVEVRVEGHTDSIGSEAYNMTLSQKRAESVVDYLVSQGIDGNNLIAVGMGETSPVANNDTAAGRAANRRVDFVVNQ